MSNLERGAPVMVEREVWQAWPVYWTAVWVGALAAIAVAMIFGLIGVAIGAHKVGTAGQITKWSQVGLGTSAWSILGSFFSFVAGGWAAASVAGIRRAEAAMCTTLSPGLSPCPCWLSSSGWARAVHSADGTEGSSAPLSGSSRGCRPIRTRQLPPEMPRWPASPPSSSG